MKGNKKLTRCTVQVTTQSGKTHLYSKLFRSSCDAVIDATKRFSVSSITVKRA